LNGQDGSRADIGATPPEACASNKFEANMKICVLHRPAPEGAAHQSIHHTRCTAPSFLSDNLPQEHAFAQAKRHPTPEQSPVETL